MRFTSHARLTLLICTLVVYGVPALAQSDEEKAQEQMKRLYTKLAGIFLRSPDPQANPMAEVLLLMHPGFLIDPALDLNNIEDRCALADLVDVIPRRSWLWEDSGYRVSNVYKVILDHKEFAPLELPEKGKTELKEAEEKLYKDQNRLEKTDLHQAYYDKAYAYATVIDELNALLAEGKSPTATLKLKRQQAQDDYNNVQGKVAVYLQNLARWSNYEPSVFWQRLSHNFSQLTEVLGTDKNVPKDIYYPKFLTWTKPETRWTVVTLDDRTLNQMSGTNSMARGFGARFGVWASGGARKNEERSYERSHEDKFKLSFEITRVHIVRPWMDTMVLKSRSWRLNKNFLKAYPSYSVISDGKGWASDRQETAVMPIFPTGLLLARNCTIELADEATAKDIASWQTTKSGGFGFGPIRFGGSRRSGGSQTTVSVEQKGAKLEIKDPQIIGVFVASLSAVPNPAEELWSEDKAKRDTAATTEANRAAGSAKEPVVPIQKP